MSARTTVVIVTYRSKGVVDQALAALEPAARAGELDCIVVDNASEDGTAEHVASQHPWARLLAGPHNLGFGRGCNAGLAQAETEFVLFLNPDAVMEPEAIAHLERFFDAHPAAGLVAPAVEFGTGDYQPVRALPTPWGIVAHEGGFANAPRRRTPVHPGGEPFETQWLCGAVLMGRRRLLEELEGFDPRFFLYFEETDLCVRARSAGAELWLVPSVIARHSSGASAARTDARLWTGCIAEHYFESRHYYLAKHFGLLSAAAAALLEIGVMMARGVAARLRGRSCSRLRLRLQAPILRMPRTG